MAGAVKDFFDRTFYPSQTRSFGNPTESSSAPETTGREPWRLSRRIALGYKFKRVFEPVDLPGCPERGYPGESAVNWAESWRGGCEAGFSEKQREARPLFPSCRRMLQGKLKTERDAFRLEAGAIRSGQQTRERRATSRPPHGVSLSPRSIM